MSQYQSRNIFEEQNRTSLALGKMLLQRGRRVRRWAGSRVLRQKNTEVEYKCLYSTKNSGISVALVRRSGLLIICHLIEIYNPI